MRLARLLFGALVLAVVPAAASAQSSAANIALAITPSAVVQGETVRVRISPLPGAGTLRLLAGGTVVPLHRMGTGWEAFVGTSVLTRPGALVVRVDVGTGRQRRVAARGQVRISAGRFGVRRLRVPPRLLDPRLVAAERARVVAATAHPRPAPLWSGPFHRPVTGPVSSGYGVRSIYNGVPRGYHWGVDFPAPPGTPVRAGQAGIVTLAELLPLSGNTVIIDHGAGIFTTYQHLQATLVTPGRRVGAGEIVGRVGSTGLSTGPHLHWGMRIHGVRVDPLYWTR